MIEIRKPSEISINDFYNTMDRINPSALKGVEGRNNGKPSAHYIARWDETIAPAPSKAAMISSMDTVKTEKEKDKSDRNKKKEGLTKLRKDKGKQRNNKQINAAIDMLIEAVYD